MLCGLDIVKWVFSELDSVKAEFLVDEGIWVNPRDIIQVHGNTRAILMGERVALNFLQRLCGISTYTRKFVDKIKNSNSIILDTRKTTPTLRHLEKYAVLMGGGTNHRMGLYDRILIKENHIKIAGGIKKTLSLVSGEIEVKNLREVKEAIKYGAKHLLLDNMSLNEVKKIVKLVAGKEILLEYSGNVTLENVKEIADTGVDYISVGALTHSYKSIDLSLLLK